MISSPSSHSSSRSRLWLLLALTSAALAAGCVDTYPADLRYTPRNDPLILDTFKNVSIPHFDPPGQMDFLLGLVAKNAGADTKLVLEPKLSGKQQQLLQDELEKLFGTPLQPKASKLRLMKPDGSFDDDSSISKELHLDDAAHLAEGSRLYRLHCLHCHGLTGNGRGPTAPWVNPHPRDFRSGLFKFTSSAGGNERKPRREDLLRTMRQGIEGTAMPSFILQPDQDLQAIASYVVLLSLRGQTEFEIIREIIAPVRGDKIPDGEIAEKVLEFTETNANFWRESEGKVVVPPDPPADFDASAQAGFKLFQKDGLGCIACHLDYGRQDNYLPDSWGTIVRATDLTRPVYRGGRRPVDLYWRVHSGINGANMPSNTSHPGERIWNVVHFLQVLPYPEMRKELKIEINQ